MVKSFWRHRSLVKQLVMRDIRARYKGSLMGVVWSVVTPLLMLVMYTFVFQFVFNARWGESGASGETVSFSMNLFLGLTIHGVLADVFNRSPRLMLDNANFVKKVVFPLEILPWVTLLGAVFNSLVAFGLLLAFVLIDLHAIPVTALLLPLILLPYFVLLLGFSWVLSAVGVYIRDIQQVMGTLVTLLMFLSPVFYSIDVLPASLQQVILLNPIAFPVEASRAVLLYGELPDFLSLAVFSVVACVMAVVGYALFQKSRSGFSDVL